MLLTDANMRNVHAELPHHLHLGIPQPGPAVLDAKRPLAAKVLMIVRDAEGLAFGDALVVVVLVATGADRVVDARETDVLHRKDQVSVRRGLVGAAGAPKTAASILGAECRRESKKEEIQGGYQLHLGDMYASPFIGSSIPVPPKERLLIAVLANTSEKRRRGVSVIQSVPDFSRFSSSIETHTRHSLC